MPYEFKLPDIGEGVAEGEVLKWFVKEGDPVKEDQPLVEVMTDKVNVQIPSPRTGTVGKLMAKEGDVVKVGTTLVLISLPGEQPSTAPSPQAPPQARTPEVTLQGPSVPEPGPASRALATPATRRLARELNVDIARIRGSGPQSRVTDDDVRAAAGRGGQQAVVLGKAAPAPPTSSAREEVVPLRGIRKTIAERMVRSKNTAAHVTHVDEVDMTELVVLREAFKGSAEKRGVKLTFLPFIVKALVPALKEYKFVNSTLDDAAGNIILKKYYNLGIAVDTEQGLVVVVVRDVDRKDIFELAGEIESLAEKARTGRLSLDEVHGATFTITNVGGIGGLFATPIINPPEAAILGVHAIKKRPVFRDGKVEVRDMMYISLSFDHRIFDGAYAARFTNKIIETIQDPKKLLTEVL
ncbi:MAG: 2-oxo acid dehydrogenase subunit E2 [Thaumarchaeota archaeon]|nr:2-oxo acid dehydrogenase subunit E2 [Nitrososphaerota archaeon]